MLDVCLPGTGGMMPLPERWLSCCWIEYQGKALLVDCGEGTQIALKKAGCKLSRLDILLVTHFHADHIAGLPGLLLTLGNHDKKTPLLIVGPQHLEAVVSSLMIIAPALPYPVELIELKNGTEGLLEDDELSVSYLPLEHGIPCFGYRVSLRRKPVFNPEKAGQLGVPKNLFKTLHAGTPVRLDDGRQIEPRMVLDGERRPLSVTYITDSVPTAPMADFARDSDLLVCEGMYGETEMRDKMEEKGHMVFADSARLASMAGAGRLWLTHFSPAMKDPETYIGNARAVFRNTEIGYDGIKTTL
ncbi:ribonuclease Z [Sporobacter termitidis DSM 10068]|uniref:Ribonuclease Z n=1 Tax=Sporobacter termitidis DSM 10068 TaxID=1123282 RepID=A0A1M5YT70_9FIRM|nr:ribonuclease Z [Sporobacter termitidis]SHI15282.1 ribonuclease Z [Sporobacter termitidis DSM 10068]